MNTELYKPHYTGSTLSKLAGISVTQFNTLRNSKLLETKERYTLQDVFYVAFCNDFRVRAGKTWQSILKLFLTIYNNDLEKVKAIDFLNQDILALHFHGDNNFSEYKSIDDPFIREFILNSQQTKKRFNMDDSLPEMFDSFCVIMGDLEECYINLLKIRQTIFENRNDLEFRVKLSIEKTLLSA